MGGAGVGGRRRPPPFSLHLFVQSTYSKRSHLQPRLGCNLESPGTLTGWDISRISVTLLPGAPMVWARQSEGPDRFLPTAFPKLTDCPLGLFSNVAQTHSPSLVPNSEKPPHELGTYKWLLTTTTSGNQTCTDGGGGWAGARSGKRVSKSRVTDASWTSAHFLWKFTPGEAGRPHPQK